VGAQGASASTCPPLDGTLDVFLERVQFDSIDFSGIQFEQFWAAGSTFVRCDFSNARFRSLDFGLPQAQWGWRHLIRPGGRRYPQTTYEECIFRRTRFDPYNTHFGNARFVRCLFDRAWLRDMLFTYSAEFVGCRFVGKVIECNFFGTIPDRESAKRVGRTTNEFRDNDFREADLIWVGFHGIDLDAQQWPASDEYAILTDLQRRIQAAIERARAEVTGEELDRVLSELDTLARYYNRERQVLVRRSELGWEVPPEVQQRLWDYLTM
jgi:uncharacterized protein YjbI with pentapeptide repeats